MEAHVAQDVKMVLMNVGGYELAEGGECAFVVGQKDCLIESGIMNDTDTGVIDWESCQRRTWCNTDYVNALPVILKNIFKQFKVISGNDEEKKPVITNDFFALPAEKEVLGKNKYANENVEESLSRLEYYNVASNIPSSAGFWLRSQMLNDNGDTDFLGITENDDGEVTSTYDSPYFKNGILTLCTIGKKVIA